ncbi:hypothetical protein MMA231_03993 (plasmid) [Asticcacaulis sp. MM231]|uniref:hypothetical protein n=1 Tax=Asticcacaulis sp. MM231 TaxID=3157666 RepID=UPI0032D5A96A
MNMTPSVRASGAAVVKAVDAIGCCKAVVLVTSKPDWVPPAGASNGVDSRDLLEICDHADDVPVHTLKSKSHLRLLGAGVKIVNGGAESLSGQIRALKGAIRLKVGAISLLVRDVGEIELDTLPEGSELRNRVRGHLVTRVNRDETSDVTEAVGIALTGRGRSVIFIPLHAFAKEAGLLIVKPQTVKEIPEEQKTDDFLRHMFRSGAFMEEGSREKLADLVGLPAGPWEPVS